MYLRISEELARQRQADMRRRAGCRDYRSTAAAVPARAVPARAVPARAVPARAVLGGTGPDRKRRAGTVSTRRAGHARGASQSLQARTGWWLVDLGLKLAVSADSRAAASPRPAGP
jgi:hypothetical protein